MMITFIVIIIHIKLGERVEMFYREFAHLDYKSEFLVVDNGV